MVYGIMFGVMAAGWALFGAIYPAIVIWLLRKPVNREPFERPLPTAS